MVLAGSQMERVGKVESLALPCKCLGDHSSVAHLDIGQPQQLADLFSKSFPVIPDKNGIHVHCNESPLLCQIVIPALTESGIRR